MFSEPFPAFHINCLDSANLPALVTGARAVILEGFSASTFWSTVQAEQATVVSVIPTVIRLLMRNLRLRAITCIRLGLSLALCGQRRRSWRPS